MALQGPTRFYWVDAFTTTPFTGNPAVVIPAADHLSDQQMQQLAREVNCSETAFICQADREEADLKLRWFTPTQEIDLCGHATIAALHILAQEKRFNLLPGTSQILYLQTRSGLLPVTIDFKEEQTPWIWLTLPNCEFTRVEDQIVQQLIPVLGLPSADHRHPVVDSLNRDLLIQVDHLLQLHELQPRFTELAQLGKQQGWRGICAYTTDTLDPANLAHSRFFAPQSGIPEDPVTGSMSGPLVLFLSQDQSIAAAQTLTDPSLFILEQGDSLGRPGRVKVQLLEGIPKLGGQAVTVLQGELCQ
ncbi:MAG: PhzF family phenazine biosynthesis protein [Acaryochloridaceae cyanobacterium SU_2_1]|nr:PhzF family phenazine biosynthesis protein [Acaryochloridaceae cyanobacterium SU_2_1]